MPIECQKRMSELHAIYTSKSDVRNYDKIIGHDGHHSNTVIVDIVLLVLNVVLIPSKMQDPMGI